MRLMLNGKTRIVFLVGKYAVKVCRIKPVEFIMQLFQLFKNEGSNEDYKRAWLRCFVWGVWANKAEHFLYKRHGGAFLIPTLFSFLGLVNIQLRGEPVGDVDILQHQLQILLKDTCLAKEFLRSEQFCLVGSKVFLVDYGTPELGKFLP